MHGVPADLPVQSLVGKELNQICLGRFQIQLHCSGTASIHVESRWELRDEAGGLIDSDCDHAGRDHYRLHRIIDLPIRQVSLDPPRSFSLHFDKGLTLTVFDDSSQYESFSIHWENGTVDII